jgi:hypothetical protein
MGGREGLYSTANPSACVHIKRKGRQLCGAKKGLVLLCVLGRNKQGCALYLGPQTHYDYRLNH